MRGDFHIDERRLAIPLFEPIERAINPTPTGFMFVLNVRRVVSTRGIALHSPRIFEGRRETTSCIRASHTIPLENQR
jgi:hypothetical protein